MEVVRSPWSVVRRECVNDVMALFGVTNVLALENYGLLTNQIDTRGARCVSFSLGK